MRDSLQTQQSVVQACLTAQEVARGSINLKKAALLQQFSLFTGMLDAYFRNTEFYDSRPSAPSITDGQETFTRQMVDMMSLWAEINTGTAPAGVRCRLSFQMP